jgi:PAS domain-containing protein
MSEKPSYRELEQKIKKMKLMENELLVTRHLFEDIVQSLPDPTFVIDKNKTIIAWNRAIEEMTGLSGKDMIGKSNYAYSVPFWGKPRPVLIDIIIDPDLENLKLMILLKNQETAL